MLVKHKTLINKTIIKQESARSKRNKRSLISEPISKLPFFCLFLFLTLEISTVRAASLLANVSKSCSLGAARLWMSVSADQVRTVHGMTESKGQPNRPNKSWPSVGDRCLSQITPTAMLTTWKIHNSLIFSVFLFLYKMMLSVHKESELPEC